MSRFSLILSTLLLAMAGTLPMAHADTVIRSFAPGDFAYNPSIQSQELGANYGLEVPPNGQAGITMARPPDMSSDTSLTIALLLTADMGEGDVAEWELVARSDKTGFGAPVVFESTSPVQVGPLATTYGQTFFIPASFTRNTELWLFEFRPVAGPQSQHLMGAQVSYQNLPSADLRSIHVSGGGFLFDESGSAVTMPGSIGLFWDHEISSSSGGGFYQSRPADWDGKSPVQVRLHFLLPLTNAGVIRWRLRASSYEANVGQQLLNGPTVLSDEPLVFPSGNLFRYFNQTFTLPADHPALDDPIWAMHFFRGRAVDGDNYEQPIMVLGAELLYESAGQPGTRTITASAGSHGFADDNGLQFTSWRLFEPFIHVAGYTIRRPNDWVPGTPIHMNVVFALRSSDTVGAIRWRMGVSNQIMGFDDIYVADDSLLVNAGTPINTILQQQVTIDGFFDEDDVWWIFRALRGTPEVGDSVDEDFGLMALELTYTSSNILFSDRFEAP